MSFRSPTSSAARASFFLHMFVAGCLVTDLVAAPDPTDSETLLMTINGQEVRQGDMDLLMQINFGPKFAALSKDEQETVRINRAPDTRSQMIDRVLLVTAAKADDIKASDEEVLEELAKVSSQLPPELTLKSYLEGIGLTLAQFRTYAGDQVLINKLSEKRTSDVSKPLASEIETYYRQNPDYFAKKERAQVSHVLISTENSLTDEQRAQKRAEAEVARRRLLASPGAFAEIVQEISNCPSRAHGGDLGVIERGQMIAAFDEAAFSQETGAIGKVIRTPKGFHVIKVTERIPAKQVTLAEATPDIEALLLFNARTQAMEGYLGTLRLSAKVVMPQVAKPPK